MKSKLSVFLALTFLSTTTWLLAVLLSVTFTTRLHAQGSLTPPGPPAPTMKTLAQIEPRTPISSLPFIITNSGSYYLTTNLTGVAGTNGITITVSGVTLDLMGFELVGVSNSVAGIRANGNNIFVRNGTVRGWSSIGVDTGFARHCQLERLAVDSNHGPGISTGDSTTVSDCTAKGNGYYDGSGSIFFGGAGITTGFGCVITGCTASSNHNGFIGFEFDGIHAGEGSTISGCTAANNGRFGISASKGSTVTGCAAKGNDDGGFVVSGTLIGCTASYNTGPGINALSGSTVSGCTATDNDDNGIEAGTGNVITDCSVRDNSGNGTFTGDACTIKGCTVSGNTGDGIEVTASCRVVDNTCVNNGNGDDAGIRVTGDGNRIESNHVAKNDFGIKVTGLKNFILRNSASGNTTAEYDWVGGNHPAPISNNSLTAGALDNFDQ